MVKCSRFGDSLVGIRIYLLTFVIVTVSYIQYRGSCFNPNDQGAGGRMLAPAINNVRKDISVEVQFRFKRLDQILKAVICQVSDIEIGFQLIRLFAPKCPEHKSYVHIFGRASERYRASTERRAAEGTRNRQSHTFLVCAHSAPLLSERTAEPTNRHAMQQRLEYCIRTHPRCCDV